ncbi:uncharacterized protein BT62DRAFT_995076 [Guyanagaster necrorhizus]|uniref:Transmembrane protein n=1 Tax=Guyanagaster necrorhizus TaxID=856835 RepID=A0A9P7VPN9_9AGAR|nr:uncharacterized protein BT62DRAFT_995076 [Guyanagaster necrorhizus MCA 3950]KAG7445111.1 hypothetical protein BT62DRAFT_995076 [Guyanagaster necrorhizus MCA 3950]
MSGVYLLLDDSNPLISYNGPWNIGVSSYGDSHCLGVGSDGSLSVTFSGTSIAFAGSTPGVLDAMPFQVNIDNGYVEDTSYLDENHYERWYQSPTLGDGIHTINLTGLVNGTDLDYVLVEAGPSTSLANSSIIIDDSSAEIRYSAGWDRNTDSLGYVDGVFFSPFGGGTTESTTQNNSFSFQFAGTAVYVYGVHKAVEGAVAAQFSVDDSPVSFVSLDPMVREDEDMVNYLFFENTRLEPGNHTLMCNVTEITGNQSFVLDYIVYAPSFVSISDKPNFFPQPGANASNPSSHSRHSASNLAISAGAIAGVVAGVTVFCFVVLALSVIWCRGGKRRIVMLSRSSSFGDATVASGGLFPPEPSMYSSDTQVVRTPLVPNRFDPNLFVSNEVWPPKYPSSRLSLSSRFRDFGIGWGYSKRTRSYPEKL